MSAGVRAFRKIQLTKESTPGTQVTPPTAQLIGTLGMQNDQKYYRPDDLETGFDANVPIIISDFIAERL